MPLGLQTWVPNGRFRLQPQPTQSDKATGSGGSAVSSPVVSRAKPQLQTYFCAFQAQKSHLMVTCIFRFFYAAFPVFGWRWGGVDQAHQTPFTMGLHNTLSHWQDVIACFNYTITAEQILQCDVSETTGLQHDILPSTPITSIVFSASTAKLC